MIYSNDSDTGLKNSKDIKSKIYPRTMTNTKLPRSSVPLILTRILSITKELSSTVYLEG